MTKHSKRLLLTFISITSVIALSFVFTLKDFIGADSIKMRSSSAKISTEKVDTRSGIDSSRVRSIITKKIGQATSVFYLANRQSGVIGVWRTNKVDNPVDNIFSVEINEPLHENDAVWLTYRLNGVKDFSNVACSINDRLAFGGFQIKSSDTTSYQRVQISPLWLTKGTNRIQFGLPENVLFGYRISDLSIEVQNDGLNGPLVAQASPSSYNGLTYVHGCITDNKKTSVRINGEEVKVLDNEFEALVRSSPKGICVTAQIEGREFSKVLTNGNDMNPDTVFAFIRPSKGQHRLFVKGEAGQLRVENAKLMVGSSALKATQKLSLTALRGVDVPALDLGLTNVTEMNSGFRFLPHGEHFSKPASIAIKYDRTKIPEGYTENDIRTFYFDPKSKHWVALERDSLDKELCMVVSKTTHFTDMINGVIKAPESPETQGFTPTMMSDIKVADPATGIQLIAPPTANNMGSANVNYNLEMPPVRSGVNPSLAIQYNSDGGSGWLGQGWDLSVPSICVDTRWGVPRYDPKYETETYSMNGVKLATIVDTLNHPSVSDTLGFVSVAHKGILFERLTADAGVQFNPVIENGFSRITRHGSNPSNYYWKVVTKDGITYTYGGANNADIKGSVKSFEYKSLTSKDKIQATKAIIAEWKLSSIEDQYRNFCRYYYSNDSMPVQDGGTVHATYNHLTRVEIGRTKGKHQGDTDTIYQKVDFVETEQRAKITTNARYGFLTMSNPKHLNAVLINQKEPDSYYYLVRKYLFSYKSGQFNNKLLDKVTQYDACNVEVGSHTFNYFNSVEDNLFNPEETISTTSVEKDSANTYKAETQGLPALGGGKSEGLGGSFFIGLDFGLDLRIIKCTAGIGFNYSTSNNTSDTKMMMIDINGDGLPDKLYKGVSSGSTGLYFIPNLGNGLFGTNGIPITGYNDDISHTYSTSSTYGVRGDITAGTNNGLTLNAGIDIQTGHSYTETYLSDVNSDGLVDIIHNGNVYFNSIKSYSNGVAIPSFSTNSGITPRPVLNIKSILGKAAAIKLSDLFLQTPNPTINDTLSSVLVVSDEPIQRDADIVLKEKREDYENIPMQDVVRVWEAPRSGVITIKNHIKYLGDPSVECTDGVRLAIQTNNKEKWIDSIKPNDSRLEFDSIVYAVDVVAGQRVYFRVQSGSNNFSDGFEDVVIWNQVIGYNWLGDDSWTDYKDENGHEINRFDSKEANFVSRQYDNIIDSVDFRSEITIGGSFSKPMTNEPVLLKLFISSDSLISKDTLMTEITIDSLTQLPDTAYVKYKTWVPNDFYEPESMYWQQTVDCNALSLDEDNLGFSLGRWNCPIHFRFEISSATNLPWEKIIWKPQLRYLHAGTGRDTTIYAGVKYKIFEKKSHDGEGNIEHLNNKYVDGQNVGPYYDEPASFNISLNTNREINTDYTLKCYRFDGSSQYPVAEYHGVINQNHASSDNALRVPSLGFGSYFFSLFVNDTISPDLITANCHFINSSPTIIFKPNIYSLQPENRTLFGHMWRGWGQFQYNSGNGRYAKPIIEDSLFVPQDTSEESISTEWGLENRCFFNLNHKPYKNSYFWSGSNDYLLVSGDTICSGRLNYGEMPRVFNASDNELAQIYENPLSINSDDATNSNGNIITINPSPTLSGPIYEIKNAPVLSTRTDDAYSYWGGVSAKFTKYLKKSIPLPPLSYNGATSKGKTKVTNAYLDLNGDGFPDYITDNKVEYTNPNGGRDGEIASIVNEYSSNESKSNGFSGGHSAGFNITPPTSSSETGGTASPSSSGTSNASNSLSKDLGIDVGFSKSTNNNNSTTTTSYIDLNGDGLPDRIHLHDDKVSVFLNQGYGFSDEIDWGLTKIAITNSISKSKDYSLGGAITEKLLGPLKENAEEAYKRRVDDMIKKRIGIQVGINTVETRVYNMFCLFDIDMDGLPDKVFKDENNLISIEFNTGTGFTPAITTEEIEEFYKAFSSSTGFNLGLQFKFRLAFFLKLSLGASGSYVTSTDYILNQMMDIDGDGFADVLKANGEKDKLSELKIKRSQIGYTNKLQSIVNSMGGKIELQYSRSKATYDHPGGKWVLSSVSTNDGILDSGVVTKDTFIYEGGKYDRYEREFAGFKTVTIKNIDLRTAGKPVYRTLNQVFDNSNYYTKGSLLKTEIVEGNSGNVYTENLNKYQPFVVSRLLPLQRIDTAKWGKYSLLPINPVNEFTSANSFLHQYIVYTPLKYSKNSTFSYNGGTQSSMVTSESYSLYNTAPGTHGELISYKFSDKGQLGEAGTGGYNYQTTISYLRNKPLMTLFSLPTRVLVKGSDGKTYRNTLAVWNDNFASQLRYVKNVIAAGDTSITSLGYDAWGNLSQEILPGTIDSLRMWHAYKYDNFYHHFPTEVSDKYGYKSYMSNYNYKFGVPCRTTDINGNVMLTSLDNLGRVSTITAPNEVANGKPNTLKFEYHPKAIISDGKIITPAYAVTSHYDECNPTDSLETVSFSSGFGRPIQVSKDAFVNGAAVSIISGQVKYDAFGRVVNAYFPTMETNINDKRLFHASFETSVPPTHSTYDVLDRVTSMTQPNGSVTNTSYNITDGLLKTTVTDAMGGAQATFTNGSGQTIKTEQYSGPDGTISTTFEYDAINQLLTVTDAKNEKTQSFYDLVGRRTKLIHPASGTTIFGYDKAGNLTSKKTANLALINDSITYEYEFYNRLKSIHYPQHPENDVTYTYGTYADTTTNNGNRAGRLKFLVDGSGAQEFKYGRMGEVVENRRTLVIPNQAVATYVTNWTYDSWNRVRTMTYPDGEVLSYTYDLGGQLSGISGQKAGFSYPYVKSIKYDKFEQRSSIKYGNDTETNYAYNDSTRNLMGLSVLSVKVNKTLMNNTYAYDKVNNILSVKNTAIAPTSGIGGQIEHHYTYDGLYRLSTATGTYAGSPGKTASYTLTMGYDNIHNITSKNQTMEQQNLQFAGTLKTGYDLNYRYTNNPQQISTVVDTSYRTDGTIVKIGKAQNYTYDANGNMLSVNTTQPAPDGSLRSINNRRLLWDEENRLLSVSDNGFVSNYWYDASGERTVKMTGESEGVLVNGILSGGLTRTTNYTVYVNPYLVISNGGQMSKHFYIGSQRVVSQLCSSGSLTDSTKSPLWSVKAAASKVNFTSKFTELTSNIKSRFDSLGVVYSGRNNAGASFWAYSTPVNETDQYYYHPDHLGSSSLITNLGGDLVQHIEYVPFGEVFIEERNSTWNTPYKFNAKELDEETGLYYYGARYYDPRMSVWLSVDPLAEKYPNVSSYVNCLDNPVKYVDPDGRFAFKCLANLSRNWYNLWHKDKASPVIENKEVKNNLFKYTYQTASKTSDGGVEITSHYKFSKQGASITQNVGDGIAVAGYAATVSVVGAEVGVPTAVVGNAISTAGTVWEVGVDLLNTDWEGMLNGNEDENLADVGKKVVFYVAGKLVEKGLNKVLPGVGKKIGKKGFNLGTEILMQGSKLKVSGAERLTDAIVEKKKAENKQSKE